MSVPAERPPSGICSDVIGRISINGLYEHSGITSSTIWLTPTDLTRIEVALIVSCQAKRGAPRNGVNRFPLRPVLRARGGIAGSGNAK